MVSALLLRFFFLLFLAHLLQYAAKMANMEAQGSVGTISWIKKIWPVQRFELKKVLPLLSLKFLVSIVYATLTCMKDSLIVTADHSGAEVIPVLKGWVVFPLSLLCAIGYSKLSNHFKRSTLFYLIVSFFLLIKQLSFTRNIAAVALRCNIFTHRAQCFSSDNFRPNYSLNWHFKKLPWKQIF